jgi:putative ABC transport system permease protein
MARRTRFRNMFGMEPEADVEAEFAFHLEMRTRELIARGEPPERARELARRRFGNYETPHRDCVVINERRRQHVARTEYRAEVRQDLAYALRLLRRMPAFTIAAVATLALGIGATVAVFSIANAVLLKPPAFPDPERVVIFETRSPAGSDTGASPAMYGHWRTLTTVVQDVAAFRSGFVNDTGSASPEQLRAGRVSANYFRLFGAEMSHGRTFSEAEDRPGGGHPVVLGHRLWMRRFDSNPTVIGQAMWLNGEAYTVVGVLSAGFHIEDFGPAPDVWLPLQLDPQSKTEGHFFAVGGRLRPGVTLGEARAAVRVSTDAFRRAFPNSLSPNSVFDAQTVRESLGDRARPLLVVLLGAVGFVLLIACANVAGLVLLQAASRGREIAVRAALGGGRWRIVRQLLTESLLLSIAGGTLGLALGFFAVRLMLATSLSGLPRVPDASALSLDWRVVTFALAASILTGMACGVVPARHVSRTNLGAATRSTDGRGDNGSSRSRTQAILVVLQISLALVLLIGSALFMRTVIALTRVEPGFDPHGVLTMRTSLSGPGFATAPQVEAIIRRGTAALRAVPGVSMVSAASGLPLEDGSGLPFVIVGRPLPAGQPYHGGGGWLAVSPGYFETLRIPVMRGRSFTERDVQRNPAVAVINEVMARQYWRDRDPVGQHVVLGHGIGREFQDEPEREIVGVVGSVRAGSLGAAPGAEIYVPQAQLPDVANAFIVAGAPAAWIVRTTAPPESLASSLQAALQRTTGLPVSSVRSMEAIVLHSIAPPRFGMWLMLTFGVAALLLATTGIYGLVAYVVQQRTREIGIRLALGADTSRVKAMVVWRGMRLTLAGVAIGLLAAFGLSRLIARWLFGVQAADPVTFLIVPLTVAIVALLASWLPARRASRIDPIIALRSD